MHEILSISLPTFNRCEYLKTLLASIKLNFNRHQALINCVKIYVFDNNSTDNTKKIVEESGVHIVYKRNNYNIGAAENIFQAYTAPTGEYVWVIGDDEIIYHNAINNIIDTIIASSPSLIIPKTNLLSCKYFKNLGSYPNYKTYMEFSLQTQPFRLLSHSFISCNIIKRSLFDSSLSKNMLYKTQYPHLYGIVAGLKFDKSPVIVTDQKILIIRKIRAAGLLEPPDIRNKYDKLKDQRDLGDHIMNGKCQYLKWAESHFGIKLNCHPLKIIFNELDLMRLNNVQRLLKNRKYLKYIVLKIISKIIMPSTIHTLKYRLTHRYSRFFNIPS